MNEIRKVQPAPDYPPEEGCYLRGNDFSPVAVVVILKWRREETPQEIERLVRVAAESGAALAGTLQTENIGLEKVVCNLVSNPNIRYLVVFGPEPPGHLVGEGDPAILREAVCACFQESPTPFRSWTLHDPGAFPEPPLSGKITWRVTHPESEPKSEKEQEQKQRVQALMDRVRRAAGERQRKGGDHPYDD